MFRSRVINIDDVLGIERIFLETGKVQRVTITRSAPGGTEVDIDLTANPAGHELRMLFIRGLIDDEPVIQLGLGSGQDSALMIFPRHPNRALPLDAQGNLALAQAEVIQHVLSSGHRRITLYQLIRASRPAAWVASAGVAGWWLYEVLRRPYPPAVRPLTAVIFAALITMCVLVHQAVRRYRETHNDLRLIVARTTRPAAIQTRRELIIAGLGIVGVVVGTALGIRYG